MRYSTILLCLLGLTAGVWSQCVQDYDCGNAPYTICDGGVNDCEQTVPGIGVDRVNNQIYFAQICRADFDRFPNVTFKRVAPTGGVPTIVQTRKQIPAAANPGIVFDVVDGYFYYSIQSRSPSQILTALKLSNLNETRGLDAGGFFQNILDLDEENERSFVGNLVFTNTSYYYEIVGFDGIIAPEVGSLPNRSLYTVTIPSILTAVRARGNDLFYTVATPDADFATYNTTLYKGSVDGAAAVAQFTVSNARIQDFDVTDDRIFYGTATGVYSSNLDGSNKKYVSWGSGATGVRVLGDRVYWNSGVSIVSDSLAGDNVQQLNTFNGHCRCRNGFTGSNCGSCQGQIQWFEGVPSCIKTTGGVPDTCNFDYECPDYPYRICLGDCQCRNGLGGDGCRQCQNRTQTISWENSMPVCK